MVRLFCILLIFLVFHPVLMGQVPLVPESDAEDIIDETLQRSSGEASTIYKNEIYGGLLVHSFGWGGNFRKGKHITAKLHRLYSFEISGMKHPKEYKSYNPNKDNNKGFVYGKLNTLTIFRPAAGIQKTMFSKVGKKGVQISYVLLGGPSIGFAKPVYLEIDPPSSAAPNTPPQTEKYDPEKHTLDNILGRAETLKGIGEATIFPGLYSKAGFHFDYASQEDLVRAFEVGLSLDAYLKRIPMMAFIENRQFFLTWYLSWHFGKRSY